MARLLTLGCCKSRLGEISQDSLVNQYGHEWLSLPPDVFAKVLQHGFPGDVYGGQYGIQDAILRVGPIPQPAMQYFGEQPGPGQMDNTGHPTDPSTFVYRYSDNDNNWQILYYQPAYYQKFKFLLDNGYIQVIRNPFNGSWLSIGAQGGYSDPRLIMWDDRFGLITPQKNYLQEQDSFWEAYGPMILFAGTMAGAIIAQQAALAASEAAATESATASAAQVGAEEGINEMGLNQALNIPITSESLQTAGVSDLASTVGSTASNGYQSPPSPSSGSGGASSTSYQAPSSSPVSTSTPTTSTFTSNPIGTIKTASGLISTGAKLVSSGQSRPTQQSVSQQVAPANLSAPNDAFALDFANSQAQSTQTGIQTPVRFNWLWLLVAGAGVYAISKRKKHHAA